MIMLLCSLNYVNLYFTGAVDNECVHCPYRSCGVYTEIITPREAKNIFPILRTDDLKV